MLGKSYQSCKFSQVTKHQNVRLGPSTFITFCLVRCSMCHFFAPLMRPLIQPFKGIVSRYGLSTETIGV
jgi:hypothetical protein